MQKKVYSRENAKMLTLLRAVLAQLDLAVLLAVEVNKSLIALVRYAKTNWGVYFVCGNTKK
jgi:hypothetical protein